MTEQNQHSEGFIVIDTARFLADHPENAGVSDAIKLARAYVGLFEQLETLKAERDEGRRGSHQRQEWERRARDAEEQYEALLESYHALHRQWNDGQEALEWIADWPHVKLYGGHETAYLPLIVHERASAAAALRGGSNPDVTVTLTPSKEPRKDNGAAPAMSPERRDALSAKDSPPGTDSRSQPGRIGSPDESNSAKCLACGHDRHTPRYCVIHDCACGEPELAMFEEGCAAIAEAKASSPAKCPNCKGHGDVMNWLTGAMERCSKCGGSGEAQSPAKERS